MHRKQLMHLNLFAVMDKSYTVKARIHYGSRSLDLTIPSKMVEMMKIKPGDIFKVDIEEESSEIIIKYTRIYKNE